MKNKLLSSVLFLAASICYFISIILTVQEGGATGYRFYLQLLSGILFFILACVMFIKSRSEKKSAEIK
jgi:ABC-type transport system involved in cytochrome c biogenesis permease subunit